MCCSTNYRLHALGFFPHSSTTCRKIRRSPLALIRANIEGNSATFYSLDSSWSVFRAPSNLTSPELRCTAMQQRTAPEHVSDLVTNMWLQKPSPQPKLLQHNRASVTSPGRKGREFARNHNKLSFPWLVPVAISIQPSGLPSTKPLRVRKQETMSKHSLGGDAS